MSSNASNLDKQSFRYIILSGLAGGFAGCVAKTVVAPLDRVKILFQASNPDFQKYAGTWRGAFLAVNQIYNERGVRGLFQGHSATLLRVFPYAAIKFMAYDQVHHVLMPTRANETNLRRFTAGAVSGVISVFFTYPLEVIRVRMAFQTRLTDNTSPSTLPSFRRAFTQIYHESSAATGSVHVMNKFPLLKFYRGYTVTLAGMIPYAGVSFLSWGFLRGRLHPMFPDQATPVADLGIGAVSGGLAQTISYPFEIVRRRMQVGGLTKPDRWLRWGETIGGVWETGGFRGFFVGLSIGYLKVVPMTAVSFAVWQCSKRYLGV